MLKSKNVTTCTCTCSQNIQPGEALKTAPPPNDDFCLVDDYIHLPSSNKNWNDFEEIHDTNDDDDDDDPNGNEYNHAGFLDLVRHTSTLVRLGEGDFSSELSLCHSCVQRYVSYCIKYLFLKCTLVVSE